MCQLLAPTTPISEHSRFQTPLMMSPAIAVSCCQRHHTVECDRPIVLEFHWKQFGQDSAKLYNTSRFQTLPSMLLARMLPQIPIISNLWIVDKKNKSLSTVVLLLSAQQQSFVTVTG